MTTILICGFAICYAIAGLAWAVAYRANDDRSKEEDEEQIQALLDWNTQRALERDLFTSNAAE